MLLVRSHENKEHVIANWEKDDSCYKTAKNLAKLCSCSSILWKVGLANDEIGYLTECWSGFIYSYCLK